MKDSNCKWSAEDLALVHEMTSCDAHKENTNGCRECWIAEAYYENERFYWWGPTGEPKSV